MTWIKTIPQKEASQELLDIFQAMRKGYPPEYAIEVPALVEMASREKGGGITDSHTLTPQVLFHSFSAHREMMSPHLPLSRAQHEMIASVVSVLNECFY